jgi:hypothetical protein
MGGSILYLFNYCLALRKFYNLLINPITPGVNFYFIFTALQQEQLFYNASLLRQFW